MTKSIRHLRATESSWGSSDIVIPDGEIAIVKTSAGESRLKVGDGEKKFSELHTLGGDYKKLTTSSSGHKFTLENNMVYHVPNVKSMTLTLPESYPLDFCCMVCMDTRRYQADFTLDGVYFTGDDTFDGEFMPAEGKRYTLFIWYATEFQGVVRGIPYD